MLSCLSAIFSAGFILEADCGIVDIGRSVFEVARELAINGMSLD
jgi:hypothetical protein